MGCVNGKQDINDIHPNIFNVTNVNDNLEFMSSGRLEVTELELVLYQKGKPPTIWPLRSLRKYGFDQEIFSFECGRRCPTGAGIYAFKCKRADQLFNIVQNNISHNLIDDNNPLTNGNDFPVVHRRLNASQSNAQAHGHAQLNNAHQPDGYLIPISAVTNARPTLSRPGSVTSNGPVSPPPPLLDGAMEHNNNKRSSLVPNEHAYTNVNAISETVQPNYTNLTALTPSTPLNPSQFENYVNLPETASNHLYMNIDGAAKDIVLPNNCQILNTQAKDTNFDDEMLEDDANDSRHSYVNIDTKDVEQMRLLKLAEDQKNTQQQQQKDNFVAIEMNYAKLDFEDSETDGQTLQNDVVSTTNHSPDVLNQRKSYATIDFKKTTALSKSINPRNDLEEGSRKTRHNSTISDVTNRHSNSLSD